MSPELRIVAEAAAAPVEAGEAHVLATLDLRTLQEAAAARRDRAWGRQLTFSPKVFLPVTNLCRNRCDYCSFRRSPGDPGEWTMSPREVCASLAEASVQGCVEALLCLGDTPENGFAEYRALLRRWGHEGTVDYLVWIGEQALATGLLPHTNAGILSRHDMQKLRRVNVSLGLMLESVSERLCERGMPHHKAPDKRPRKRLRMTEEAGELGIPFTSGILIGIGETLGERVETILAIRALHRRYGHIQEVIVQNFRAHPSTPMGAAPEPSEEELLRMVALARLVLDDEVSVQAPPNLSPASIHGLIGAGINDFGGISPVTPDFINPGHPWPHRDRLARTCAAAGFELRPRLPVYPAHLRDERFVDPSLRAHVDKAALGLAVP